MSQRVRVSFALACGLVLGFSAARAQDRALAVPGMKVLLENAKVDVFWGEPVTHTVENLGTNDIHNLIVELKER
jgi:predicted NAD-dependent protein-ADP-ribosyltransferase YbiA (DUF1768 family)